MIKLSFIFKIILNKKKRFKIWCKRYSSTLWKWLVMKEVKIPNYNRMNKKCCSNSMNNYWLKVIHRKKLQNISENVYI